MMQPPSEIKLHKKSRILEVRFVDRVFLLPCEYLRVYSPSAEVSGHGASERKLEVGKQHVNITAIEPVGNYAVKLIFDDGHNTGLYSWETLYDLGVKQTQNWQDYLARLAQAGFSR